MSSFVGDHTCKVDSKGRILFPAALKKQMVSGTQESFVVKKDIYENCLVIYTAEEWQRQNDIIRKNTNPYNKEHNRFLRAFYHGTAEMALDASNRILVPKRLLEECAIGSEVVLSGQDKKIEIWDKKVYDQTIDTGSDFSSLAESILGNITNDNES